MDKQQLLIREISLIENIIGRIGADPEGAANDLSTLTEVNPRLVMDNADRIGLSFCQTVKWSEAAAKAIWEKIQDGGFKNRHGEISQNVKFWFKSGMVNAWCLNSKNLLTLYTLMRDGYEDSGMLSDLFQNEKEVVLRELAMSPFKLDRGANFVAIVRFEIMPSVTILDEEELSWGKHDWLKVVEIWCKEKKRRDETVDVVKIEFLNLRTLEDCVQMCVIYDRPDILKLIAESNPEILLLALIADNSYGVFNKIPFKFGQEKMVLKQTRLVRKAILEEPKWAELIVNAVSGNDIALKALGMSNETVHNISLHRATVPAEDLIKAEAEFGKILLEGAFSTKEMKKISAL